VGGRPRELNATHLGQGFEKLGFELTSLVGQLKQAVQPVSRVRATVLAVMSGMGTTSGQRVKWSVWSTDADCLTEATCWRPAFYPVAAGLSASQLEAELKLWTLVG
jgi:hypothetical protein